MVDLQSGPVMITGGTGFLGSWLADVLIKEYGVSSVITVGLDHVDLTYREDAGCIFDKYRPKYVFHLAGYNGGIKFNQKFPADIFYQNTVMGLNVIDWCYRAGVEKVVSVVASCAYPAQIPEYDYGEMGKPPYTSCEPCDFFAGEPHYTVACHGYAKRNLQLASQFYREQYDLKAVCVCPTTLYGPRDSVDPDRTKVVGAMVKRFVDAVDDGLNEVRCWGNGRARRELLYVEDAARRIAEAMLEYDNSNLPLNLGSGREVSVRTIAELAADAAGYNGRILWGSASQNGQPAKKLVDPKANSQTSLEDGIAKTVAYYRELKNEMRCCS